MDCNCGDVAKTVCVERTVESCPEEPGWEVVHGRCFYFSINESTYEDAENDCTDKGGRLFEPKNAEANTLVRRDFALNDKREVSCYKTFCHKCISESLNILLSSTFSRKMSLISLKNLNH